MVNRLHFILLGIMAIGLLAGCNPNKPPVNESSIYLDFTADSFNPVTDVNYYLIYAFRVSDFVTVTKPQLQVTVPDTLEVSWNQPKRRTSLAQQPKPQFYQHVDTAFVNIKNSPELYRWLPVGNDSSVWIDAKLQGLYEGSWELSVRTVPKQGGISQYSEPFQFKIEFVKVPAAPVDLRLWIKP